MKKLKILLPLLLCLMVSTMLQAQNLDRKISVQYKNVTIEEILKDLTKKYKVQFSYSNTIVPVKRKVNVAVKDKSLREVLVEIFKTTDIDFEEIGSHIVLKKNPNKKPVKSENTVKPVVPSSVIPETGKVIEKDESKEENFVSSDTVTFFSEKQFETFNPPDTIEDEESLRKKYLRDRRKLKQQYYQKLDSMNLGSNEKRTKTRLKNEFKRILGDLKDQVHEFKERHNFGSQKDSLKKEGDQEDISLVNTTDISPGTGSDSIKTEIADTTEVLNADKPVVKEEEYRYAPVQLTFVTPIGSNGKDDFRTVNIASFNLLAGRSAGLEGFEFGGLVNIEGDYVWGAQFAGLSNVVRNDVRGVQFGGLLNINGGNTQGGQFAGFMNMVSDNVFAVQGAGFMNIVSGNFNGTQFAGFMNVTGMKSNGFQGAGFMNLSGSEFNGGQAAGFMNLAGAGGDGVQIAGFMNVAADSLKGAQIAGFMNVADVVTGSQIGFFNFADSVTGAQIGFLSFAVKGYRRIEMWGSESLYGNIAFKTGTRYFYNILAAGARPLNDHFYWAFGYGFGSEISVSRKVKVNVDLLCYNVHKDGLKYDELNLLNQFRTNVGWMIGEKASIFAGPVFNVMVSDHYNPETATYGSPLVPDYAFYNKTHDKVNVAMWVGGNVGIRF